MMEAALRVVFQIRCQIIHDIDEQYIQFFFVLVLEHNVEQRK